MGKSSGVMSNDFSRGQLRARLSAACLRESPQGAFPCESIWLSKLKGNSAGNRACVVHRHRRLLKAAHPSATSVSRAQPGNYLLIGVLALTNMGLGDKVDALALSERGMAGNPIERDAINGPGSIEILARVAAQMGEPDRAIATIQKLLSIPSQGCIGENMPLTSGLLRLDPMFGPLRKHPRFQKLANAQR